MDKELRIRWQAFVDQFKLYKPGVDPWDADLLNKNLPGCSAAERQAILFLLHAWDPGGEWESKFEFFEAFPRWDELKQQAFINWCKSPIWP